MLLQERGLLPVVESALMPRNENREENIPYKQATFLWMRHRRRRFLSEEERWERCRRTKSKLHCWTKCSLGLVSTIR